MRAVALALLVALSSCSSNAADPPATTEAPVFALYGALSTTRLAPFPSDRYTKADPSTPTGLRVDVTSANTNDKVVELYPKTVADLNTLDGFSTVGGMVLGFSGDIDPASVMRGADGYAGKDAPAVLLDVDDGSPEKGKTVFLLPLYTTTADGAFDYVGEDHTLILQPAKPLRPKTKYLFVLTNKVKSRGGAPVQATAETRALLDGAEKGPYGDRLRALLPVLESSQGIGKSAIVAASTFTTQTVHDELFAAAEARRAAMSPTLKEAPRVVEAPMGDDKRVRFATSFDAPEYRTPKPGGRFVVENGKPTPQSTAQLEMLLAFSDSTKSGPRPIVIYGHGLGGDKEGVWGTADRLAALNVAVFAIDAPEHGSRSAKPGDSFGSIFAFFGIDSATKGESFVLARARDNFRQMALDQLELVRLIASLKDLDVLPLGAPDGIPDLDTTKILYLGHSFGSVMGPTAAALAPEIQAAVWNVGGAGLTTLLRDSNTFKFIIDALRPVGTPQGDVNRFFAVTQAIIDRGDPLNYAKFVTLEAPPGVTNWRPRDVLLQEVFGDSIVPNSTTELLARATGLVHQLPKRGEIFGLSTTSGPVTANLPTGATGAIAQFERGADGKLIDHGSLIFAPEGRAQYVEFFRTVLEKGRATVPPPP